MVCLFCNKEIIVVISKLSWQQLRKQILYKSYYATIFISNVAQNSLWVTKEVEPKTAKMNGAEKYCPEHFGKEERLIVKSYKWQTVQDIHVLYQIYQAYSNYHTFKGN